jgi:hypothetical protein
MKKGEKLPPHIPRGPDSPKSPAGKRGGIMSAATGQMLPRRGSDQGGLWDDLLPGGDLGGWESGQPADQVLAESRALLGIGPRRVHYRPDGPDVSGLKAAIGEDLFP